MPKEFTAAFNSTYAAPLAMPARLVVRCSAAASRPFVNAVKNIANFFNGEGVPPLFDAPKSKPLAIVAALGVLGVGAFTGLYAAMTFFDIANPLVFAVGIAGAFTGLAVTPFVVGAGLMAAGALAGAALSPLAAGYGIKKLSGKLFRHDAAPKASAPEKAHGATPLLFRIGKTLAASFRNAVERTDPAKTPVPQPAAPAPASP